MTKIVLQIDPKYYPLHKYLTHCCNICASILKLVDAKHLCNFKLNFQSEEHKKSFAEITEVEGDWQHWLIENGYAEPLYRLYYAHTFYSLVADYCNYLLESINCAAQMKVAVSYALLRKPFKDNLAYIEWLYIDHRDIISRLLNESPSKLLINKKEVKGRIEKIKALTDLYGFYETRYDSSDPSSLEHIWNNANHLVTTYLDYSKTPQGSLNLIFPNETYFEDLTDFYYFIVPGLVSYATDLICDVFETLAELNTETIKANHVIRVLRHASTIDTASINDVLETCRTNNIELSCPQCGESIPLISENIDSLLDDAYICKCGYTLKTGFYMFDWE